MKKITCLVLSLLLCTAMSARHAPEQRARFRGIPVLEENENGCTWISTRYDDETLDKISAFNGTLEELNAQYPIECIRNQDGIHFRFFYLGEDRIVVWHYDRASDTLVDPGQGTVVSGAFDWLQGGDMITIDELQTLEALDPYVTHPGTRYYGITVLDSLYYTTDGYQVYLEFDEDSFDKDNNAVAVKEKTVSLL